VDAEIVAQTPTFAMADEQEFAAVGADEVVPELVVKEGEDIDYRVVLAFYLCAVLGLCTCMRWRALHVTKRTDGRTGDGCLHKQSPMCMKLISCVHAGM
jgi:hypothetical protein